ncbi:MAG: methyltransferase domain-containing protein [Sulfurovaceae bacterium]|nr:methyltransferase domain-containing protein [Sulfurovaceae bacterium]
MEEVKINLGSGMINKEGYLNCDIRPYKGVKHVFDVGKDKFPFEDNSVSEIIASHLLEHLEVNQLFNCLDECWRILKPEGILIVDVPKGDTPAYYAHPDHKMQFIEDTFAFFQVPSGGIDGHGYLNHFWHIGVTLVAPQIIQAKMYPNKYGNTNYPYVKITRSDGEEIK